jgi:hypothetical protein
MSIDIRSDGRVFLAGETSYALPTAVGCDGNTLRIKNRGPAAVAITPSISGQTVDDGTSITLPVRQTAVFASDGANWDMLGGIETGGAPALGAFPSGGIVLWHGLLTAIPTGWFLCDGTHGTPDLRDRFVVGAGIERDPGATGGTANHSHTAHTMLTHAGMAVAEHPAQAHVGANVSAHAGAAVADHAALPHTDAAVSVHTGAAVSAHTGAAVSAHTGCAVTAHTSVATKQGTAAGNVITTGTHTVTQPAAHTVTQPANHTVTQPDAHTVTQATQHPLQSHVITQSSDHTVTQADAHVALGHTVTQPNQHAEQGHSTVSNLPPFYEMAYIMKA